MAITDIDISEELVTNAPSIKYTGNEGPKSPQEEQMMMADALLKEEYNKYVFDLLEIRPDATPMTLEEFRQMVIAEGQMSRGPILPSPEDPINPFQPKPQGPVLPNRQMAAYGGIMGLDGRRKYGIGSSIKKRIRKIIPNEIAEVAVKAAPFVAPFNPIAAGLMSGIGSFDQTGRIGSSLKSGLLTYGGGQLARGIGGGMDNLQGNPFKAKSFGEIFQVPRSLPGNEVLLSDGTFKDYFNSPIQEGGGLGEIFSNKKNASKFTDLTKEVLNPNNDNISSKTPLGKFFSKVGEYVPTSFSDLTDPKKLLGAFGIYKGVETLAKMGPEQTVSEIMERGEGLDLDSIRLEVREAFKDSSGQKLAALRNKYPYLGTQASKDIANMAMGGRIGFSEGTDSMTFGLLSENSEISDEINQKVIDYENEYMNRTGNVPPEFYGEKYRMQLMQEYMNQNKANGGRINRAEGGIMDLGGMEKDYRNTGGFVDLGAKEKADDVPARLSVNEFVFTADAVRNAGGGDIDKGAEVMENMMKNLEQGGQVSQESQGIQSLRAGGRAGFANGLTVDTDKLIEDIRKFSIPGLSGSFAPSGLIANSISAANKISDIDLETIIKVVAKVAPGGMVVEKVTEFLVDRYGMSPDEAQMRIVNKLGTDANEGFKQPSGTSDEGYRMVGIESSAEDTSDIPKINRLRNLLSEVPSIEMPKPDKPKLFPRAEPYRPKYDDDGNLIRPYKQLEPYRPKYDDDGNLIRPEKQLLRDMFNTSERLSEVVG